MLADRVTREQANTQTDACFTEQLAGTSTYRCRVIHVCR